MGRKGEVKEQRARKERESTKRKREHEKRGSKILKKTETNAPESELPTARRC